MANSIKTVGSFCTGIGGLDTPVLEMFDAELVWNCDNDLYVSKFLEATNPDVPNLGDLTALTEPVEPVDFVCAGFPCTDISMAGLGAGLDGDRSGIWFDILEHIAKIRPLYLFVENVAQLASSDAGQRVLDSLSQIGYGGAWGLWRSGYYTNNPKEFAHVGAPHQRNRFFMLAKRMDSQPPHWSRLTPPTQQLSSAIGPVEHLLPTAHANMSTGAGGTRQGGGNLQTAVKGLLSPDDEFMGWGKFLPAMERWQEIFGHPIPEPFVPSARSFAKSAHRLNPEVPEWIMGFEPGYLTQSEANLSYAQQMKMIGNSVQPQVSALALRSLWAEINQ